jgi:hypothetical protein
MEEKNVSRLKRMREMLNVGATKIQLEALGLKMNTVNCQLYHHLPKKYIIKKEGLLYQIVGVVAPQNDEFMGSEK